MHHAVDMICAHTSLEHLPEFHGSFGDGSFVETNPFGSTPNVFSWLLELMSLQGISDQAAFGFMDRHGRANWDQINGSLLTAPSCSKLTSHWHFAGCGFSRSKGTCNAQEHYPGCPLPSLPLRNGSLNQNAFSLYLFVRDVCEGDLVGWIDRRLEAVPDPSSADYPVRLGQSLIGPLRHVHGVSDKLLNMALSDLLIGAGSNRPLWVQAGQHMIAIDSLVHNLLHRTGILHEFEAEHSYGPACYRPNGCEFVVRRLAAEIDARHFHPSFPKCFPRFVQHALGSFAPKTA